MQQHSELSPVLPFMLASLLDAGKDSVLIVSSWYTGLEQAFASQGFKVRLDKTPTAPLPDSVEEGAVLIGMVPLDGVKEDIGVAMIRRCLNSAARRLYLIVVQAMLFSNRVALRTFRKELLERNLVEASIMLPERLLPDTGVSISLLILDKDRESAKSDGQVRFINASDLDTKRIGALVKAGTFDVLRGYVRSSFSYARPDCASVDVRDLLVRGESLLASAHCLTGAQQKAASLLEGLHTEPLGSVVNFFRPLLPSSDGKGEQLNVLNVAQFSSFGYTKSERQTQAYVERAGKTDQLIQPGDVLLCIRGALGKVAIASNDFSIDEPWIASASAIILRPASKAYDPRLLFLYLRSELGQELLKKLACGATVPMVQMKDLKSWKS